ncbi:MAG: hypothetical protein G01um1014107_39 [Parcubacteria group bacterium Gr01-1014_107]|nr:MAG: hypothetical protein G01um1014107_39 [Parcubacteria group bacterium Gr01-1014_107]
MLTRKSAFIVTFFLVLVFFAVIPFLALAQQLENPFGGQTFGQSLIGFVTFILENIVLPIGAVIAVFFLVFAGFLFVTARGDEERLRLAKKTLLWTVVGVAVLLGSVAISTGIQETICQIAPGTPLCQ